MSQLWLNDTEPSEQPWQVRVVRSGPVRSMILTDLLTLLAAQVSKTPGTGTGIYGLSELRGPLRPGAGPVGPSGAAGSEPNMRWFSSVPVRLHAYLVGVEVRRLRFRSVCWPSIITGPNPAALRLQNRTLRAGLNRTERTPRAPEPSRASARNTTRSFWLIQHNQNPACTSARGEHW